ncbi:hypothetical protein FRC14_003794 [Serendipita sp. 396]|nr:hypothetical protein FRC14_003794 [Serendipita sp. 396]
MRLRREGVKVSVAAEWALYRGDKDILVNILGLLDEFSGNGNGSQDKWYVVVEEEAKSGVAGHPTQGDPPSGKEENANRSTYGSHSMQP